LIKELEKLIRKNEETKKNMPVKKEEGKTPMMLGGLEINEHEFEDENLCQLCCF